MKYARVFLKGSDNPLRWIDVPLGSGTFAGFYTSVRMNGAVVPTLDCPVAVPWDEIKYMCEIDTGTQEPLPSFFHPQGKPN